ncbi:ROK family protein [Arcanobacterium ihumii]|uniref:ROK family protein n=1 Tax=Arcanobacterium ihumii TaxID=2138162 RepID=UPI000F54778A|nr:ROK family protein [Arcanobacterium ihumii]
MDSLIALDIGGTKIGWGIVEISVHSNLRISECGSIPTLAQRGGADVAQRICALVSELVSQYPHSQGVAIASAGVVDPRTGVIVSATNTMPGWGSTELADLISKNVHLTVRVLNDVHAHGLGEARLGAGRDHNSTLSIAVGTGIGGALVNNGNVYYGSHFLAGHVGHIHHHFAQGQQCSCGRSGHIEAICSGSGITTWYNARLEEEHNYDASWEGPVANGRELQERADAGAPLAKKCFVESGFALGEAIASLANSLDPAIIVLSGSMTRSGQLWWDAVRGGYDGCAMDGVANTPVVHGDLGDDAPLLGAALNFLRR